MATALTIGNFDGVHVGHAALIERCRRLGDRIIALAFDPHPLTRIRPAAAPARLTTFEQRESLLKGLGADVVERLDPEGGVLALTPDQFVRVLVDRYQPGVVVEGDDFRFGKGRSGDVRTLAALGAAAGFACEVVAPVEVSLSDHLIARASSSMARWLIERGRVADAARVLGRAYEVVGEVVQGDRRGRALGVPTANIRTEQLIPGDGVYAGRAVLPDGREFAAAINAGTRPTFDGVGRRVEAHLLDVPREGDCIAGLAEYGWTIRLRIGSWLRDDLRFDSVTELCEQMGRDLERCRG